MVKLLRIFSVFALLFSVATISYAQKSDKFTLKTIVIDPGHGGTDAGACRGKIYEKDIVLKVALLLGDKIKRAYPDMNVVYTRDKDIPIPLDQRGTIANNAKGDFFISIHVNSTDAKVTEASGTETFTLGLHKSAANFEVAKKENSVITLEDDYQKKYEGFDPDNAESYIMFGLGQYSFNVSSITFAGLLEDNFKRNDNKFKSRGLKQAGLLVLWRTLMPSVLTEIGFINNPNDRKILTSDSGQECIAQSLFNAFKAYKEQVEVESHYSSNGNNKGNESVDNSNTKIIKYTNKSVAYAIQLLTSDKKMSINSSNFGKFYPNIIEIKEKNKYKYLVGVMKSYDDALSLRSTMRKSKFKDCFIVGIKNGDIVSQSEIKKLKK